MLQNKKRPYIFILKAHFYDDGFELVEEANFSTTASNLPFVALEFPELFLTAEAASGVAELEPACGVELDGVGVAAAVGIETGVVAFEAAEITGVKAEDDVPVSALSWLSPVRVAISIDKYGWSELIAIAVGFNMVAISSAARAASAIAWALEALDDAVAPEDRLEVLFDVDEVLPVVIGTPNALNAANVAASIPATLFALDVIVPEVPPDEPAPNKAPY